MCQLGYEGTFVLKESTDFLKLHDSSTRATNRLFSDEDTINSTKIDIKIRHKSKRDFFLRHFFILRLNKTKKSAIMILNYTEKSFVRVSAFRRHDDCNNA